MRGAEDDFVADLTTVPLGNVDGMLAAAAREADDWHDFEDINPEELDTQDEPVYSAPVT